MATRRVTSRKTQARKGTPRTKKPDRSGAASSRTPKSSALASKAPGRTGVTRRKAALLPREGKAPVRLVFHEVDAKRWGDFTRLFESRGGPSYCWCMAWRATSQEAQRLGKEGRRDAMEQRVRSGVPVGILGYLDGEPVAWCSIAPRETHRASLGGVEAPGDTPGSVWSLTCFFVSRAVRGQGVTRQLVEAAMAHARKRGARSLEAYPVDPESPSYRFMGFVGLFEGMGFREVGTAGSRRHVMRHDLHPT
jgi:GNAT superfamily N-acetyltransferase